MPTVFKSNSERRRLKMSSVTCVTAESSMSMRTKLRRRAASSTTARAFRYASSGSIERPNCVSFIETFDLIPVSSMRARMVLYSRTSPSVSSRLVTASLRWSKVAVQPMAFRSRMARMVVSMSSPATKRVVIFWKGLNFVAKSFSPSRRERKRSALLATIVSSVSPCRR